MNVPVEPFLEHLPCAGVRPAALVSTPRIEPVLEENIEIGMNKRTLDTLWQKSQEPIDLT